MKVQKIAAATLLGIILAAGAALSQERAQVLNTLPEGVTITDWYKQNVYDQAENKIGEVRDVIVTPSGTIGALIVDVGSYIGGGAKDVAVSFRSIRHAEKNNKVFLQMDTTKDALRTANGFKYDKNTTKWDLDIRR